MSKMGGGQGGKSIEGRVGAPILIFQGPYGIDSLSTIRKMVKELGIIISRFEPNNPAFEPPGFLPFLENSNAIQFQFNNVIFCFSG